jgi:hypothetical protein
VVEVQETRDGRDRQEQRADQVCVRARRSRNVIPQSLGQRGESWWEDGSIVEEPLEEDSRGGAAGLDAEGLGR